MMKLREIKNLDPIWVSGFLQGEGCFSISFFEQGSKKPKVEVRPSFSVTQPTRSKEILFHLQAFFGCGHIRLSRKDGCYRYEVRSLPDLVHKILPHFDTFPFVFLKAESYEIFKRICLQIHANQHKNPESLKGIIESAYSINLSGTRKYSKEHLLKLVTS